MRLVGLIALATVASAASWPMITVNSAGDIVLNAITRAQSFQLTPAAVSAAPASGSATISTVTELPTDSDTFKVTVANTIGTNAGFKLPVPTIGRTITLYNDGTGAGAFTVWSSATTVFFNSGTSATYAVAASTTWVKFTATTATNWAVTSSAAAKKNLLNLGTDTAADTLSTSEFINGFHTYTSTTTTAPTLTTPTGAEIDAALVDVATGDSFEFTLYCSSTGGAVLAGGSNVAFPTSYTAGTEGFVRAGERVTFGVYRTATSGTYTIFRKSSSFAVPRFETVTSTTKTLVAQEGGATFLASGAAVAFTLPACTASTLGLSYRIAIVTAEDPTITAVGTDVIQSGSGTAAAWATDAGAAPGVLTLATDAAVAASTLGGADHTITCIASGIWFSFGMASTTGLVA